MLKGLTRAGLGEIGDLETFIALAAKYGFQVVDAGGNELQAWVADKGSDHARSYLKQHGVMIGSIGLGVEWRTNEDDFRASFPRLAAEAETAAALGCTSCCTYILPSTDHEAAHFMALATRRLRQCAQTLGVYGIRLGLEFVGPHHLRRQWKNPFIWTLQATLDWIDTIGEPNVGLLFDAYHWYTNELSLEAIAALRPDQIVHVHINDAPDVPVSEAHDFGRLYTGEGVIDLAGFLHTLNAIGYRGVVSQEVLNANPPALPTETLLERSQAGFRKVFAAAGLE